MKHLMQLLDGKQPITLVLVSTYPAEQQMGMANYWCWAEVDVQQQILNCYYSERQTLYAFIEKSFNCGVVFPWWPSAV